MAFRLSASLSLCKPRWLGGASGALALVLAVPAHAESYAVQTTGSEPPIPAETTQVTLETSKFAQFAPGSRAVNHRIDYEIWDYALKQLVVPMGPSLRKSAGAPLKPLGTRIPIGHNSRYRLEGSMMGFSFFDQPAIDSFTEYRQDLERVASELDIPSLPRNEQLAFWFNLHNVAMVEQIAQKWPARQPRSIEIDGVALHDAKIITIRGVPMSLRDIRENIVFANWRDPKVIYGFWRGEIGGPALERDAFTGENVSFLLDMKAEEFVNSLRGTQKRGKTMDVSTLYEDTKRFYFTDFDADVRTHIARFANKDVKKILKKTTATRSSIKEWDIADLAGGRRGMISQHFARPVGTTGALALLAERSRKFQYMRRKDIPLGRVFIQGITAPDDEAEGQVQ